MNTFYTDDVAVFSASQRLSLREDPTQPLIQVTRQGSSGVFEPDLYVTRAFRTAWGDTDLTARAQGFLYTNHTDYSHATLGGEIEHAFPGWFVLRFRYHFGPRLLLGDHEESQVE